MTNAPQRTRGRPALYSRAIFAAAVATFVYLSSIPNGFVSDDRPLILSHPFTRQLATWPRIFTAGHYAGNGGYRPLTTLTFAIDYALGGTEALGYHLVNVALHAATSALVYLLLWRLLRSRSAALAGALIFAVHPVHTEAVAWISGRAELLSALLFISAWLLYERSTRQEKIDYVRLGGSLLCFFGAALSKENSLVFPGALVLGDLLTGRLAGRDSARYQQPIRTRLTLYSLYLAVVGVYFAFRGVLYPHALLRARSQIAFIDNPLARIEFGSRIATALRIQGEYLWLLVWPRKLCGDYSFNAVPIAHHFSEIGVILSIVTILGCVGIAAYSFWRRGKVWFGIAFYILAMMPVSNLLTVIGTIKAERLLYLPSLGFCIGAGLGWRSFGRTIDARFPRTATMEAVPLFVLIAVIGAAGVKTWRRNAVWRDEFTFYSDTAGVAPQNIKAQLEFGYRALTANYIGDAILAFRRAVKIDPESQDAVMNLGVALMQAGREEEAVQIYREAIAKHPARAAFHLNLSLAYLRLNQNEPAVAEMRRALELEPSNATYHFNLGLLLSKTGTPAAAIPEYREAVRLQPQYAEAWNGLGATLLKLDRLDEAAAALHKAVELRPRFPEAVANLHLLEKRR